MKRMIEAHVSPRRYTLAEFLSLPEGTPGELVGGYLIVNAAPFRPHQRIVVKLSHALMKWLEQHPEGEVNVAPFDVVLDPAHVLQPDLLYVSNARRHILRDRCEGPPDLVVEVLSKNAAYDRVHKLPVYARFGVPKVWLIDTNEKTFECLDLDGATYRLTCAFAEEDLAQPPGFDALELPLGPLFALP